MNAASQRNVAPSEQDREGERLPVAQGRLEGRWHLQFACQGRVDPTPGVGPDIFKVDDMVCQNAAIDAENALGCEAEVVPWL